jgi:hypothetical protein
VRRKDNLNQMSVSNLSIVFGPTLLGAPPEEGGLNLEHMSFQCKVGLYPRHLSFVTLSRIGVQGTDSPIQAIETILEKYNEIFVEEGEDEPAPAA